MERTKYVTIIWISATLKACTRHPYWCDCLSVSLYNSCCCFPDCLWTRDWPNIPGFSEMYWNRVLSPELQSWWDWSSLLHTFSRCCWSCLSSLLVIVFIFWFWHCHFYILTVQSNEVDYYSASIVKGQSTENCYCNSLSNLFPVSMLKIIL